MEKPIINSFNTLVPLVVDRYERYLPTAFDDSLSLLEKMNMIINYLNSLGKISNDVVTQWNAVMAWVTENGIDDSVTTRLDKLTSDGTLYNLINGKMLNDIKNSVGLKADQSYVDTKFGNLGNVKTFKGSSTLSALPSSNNANGDYYYVTDTAPTTNYMWNGSTWINIGNNFSSGKGVVGYDNLSSEVVTVSKSQNILNVVNVSHFNISSGGVPTLGAGNDGYKFEIVNGKRYGLFRTPSSGTGIISWLPRVSITDELGNVLQYFINTTNDITINNANAKYMWVWQAGWLQTDYTTYSAMVLEDFNGSTPAAVIPYFKTYQLNGVLSLDWKDKTQSTYGDSITSINNGYAGQNMSPDYASMWGAYVHNYFKMKSFYGRGIGGQTFTWNTSTWFANADGSYADRPPNAQPANTTIRKGAFCSWERIKTMYPDTIRNNIDVILVMGGTNDFSVNNPIGGNPSWSANNTTDSDWVADTTNYNGGDYDLTTFKGAIASTVMKLQKRCPNALIVLVTQLSGQGGNTSKNPLVNTLNLIPLDYAKALIETAQFMSVPYIDVFGRTGINQINSTQFITDGTHPYTVDGNKALARVVIGGLKGIMPKLA